MAIKIVSPVEKLVVNGTGGTLLDVQGSAGQLFSVTDSLTGDLFAVSDISGIPILNVNSSGAVDIDGTLVVGGSITTVGGNIIAGGAIYPTSNGSASLGLSNKQWAGLDLSSSSAITWGNGDAEIIEGETNNYSLTFKTYDGTNNSAALRLDGNNTATFTGNVLINQTSNLTSTPLQVNGFIDITDVTGTALRWYNGTTFRGGLGTMDWALSGQSASDIGMYIAGDNSFFVLTNNVSRLEINSSGATFAGTIAASNLSGSNTGDQTLPTLSSLGAAAAAHNHDGRYLRTHTRYSDDLDTINASGVYIWDVSEADDEPTSAGDGLLTIKYWDSTDWATASFQDFHNRTLHIKSKKSGTWQTDWAQVWTTDQLTTTNKSNYDTAYGWGDHGLSAQDKTDITNLSGTNTGDQDLSSYATQTYVGTQISNLVDSSPAALNTLNELAAALGDDASFSTTVNTNIATKLPLAGGTLTGAFYAQGSLPTTPGMSGTGIGLGQASNYAHAQFSGSAGGYIDFSEPNVDWSGRILYTHSSDSMVFYTATTAVLTLDSSNNATFAGTVTLPQHLKASGSNLSFSAGGNQILNIDLNGKVYPSTDNAVDLGFSTTGNRFRAGNFSGVLTASGGNSTNWNTAYGWGDHGLSTQDKTDIGNLSGTNTGDQTLSSLGALPIAGGTITGDLTVNGKITQDGVVDREEWGRTYAASNTTIATLITSDGNALPTGGAYRMTGHISGTGTEQVSVAVFWNENGTWYCNNTFAGGTSSNHIEFLISGTVPKIKTWHANDYNINVTHERLSLDEGTGTDNLRGYFGADSFLKWTESTNALVVPGTIAATNLSGSSSGTNTGDQTLPTLSSLGGATAAQGTLATNALPKAGGTLTGNLSIQADSAFFFVKSADYTLSRIIPRGVGADLDKGLFSLYSVGTENVRIDSAGNSWFNGGGVGIGTTNPSEKLEVVGIIESTTNGNRVKGNISLGIKTNNSAKWHSITGTQYGYTAEPEGYSLINGASGDGVNAVNMGGGLNEQNAATQVSLWTAANVSTRTGTERMRIASDGTITFHAYGAGILKTNATGVVSLDTNTYAPLASPALTGTPTAPTAGATVNTTQLATTAFVQTAVSNLVDSSPSALNTLNELAAALGDDASFSTTVNTNIATKLPLAGGTLTGDLQLGSFGNNNVEFVLGQTIANKTFNYGAEIQTQNSDIQLVLGRNNGTSIVGTGALGASASNAFHVYDTTSITKLFEIAQTTGNATISGTIAADNFSGSSSGTNTGDQTLSSLGGATAAQGTTADAALPKAGGTMTGDLVMADETINFTTGGSVVLPQFTGKRATTDLDSRTWSTEGGWAYTTFDSNTLVSNTPSTGLHNANGLLTFNTHTGAYMAQIAMTTNTQKLWTRAKNGSGWMTWYQIFTSADFTAANVANGVTAYGWGDHGLSAQDKTDIGNLSGTNTGDQTLPTLSSLGGATAAQGTLATNALPKAGGTMTGNLTVSSGTNGDSTIIIESDTDNSNENDNPQLHFKQDGGLVNAYAGLVGDGGNIFTGSATNAAYFGVTNDVPLQLFTNSNSRLTINGNGTINLEAYGAGILKTDTNGLISLDTNTYSTASGVEDNADVTDATNVAAAGALMTAGGTLTGQLVTGSGGLGIVRSSTNGTIWFNSGTDVNHALWNAYYGESPTTRGSANTGFDGMFWNTLRGLKIRGGSAGAYNLIVAENSTSSTNDHTVKLYASNVLRLQTTTTGVSVTGDIKIDSALLSNQENIDVDSAAAETVAQVAHATYTAAFFDFVIKNGTNVRAGTVYSCHDGTNVEFTETSTVDLGDTSDVSLSVDISGTNMRLRATTTSDNWIIKSLVRAI